MISNIVLEPLCSGVNRDIKPRLHGNMLLRTPVIRGTKLLMLLHGLRSHLKFLPLSSV